MQRLYGVTEDGHSCLVHVHGYEPYFYVQAPPGMTVCIDPKPQTLNPEANPIPHTQNPNPLSLKPYPIPPHPHTNPTSTLRGPADKGVHTHTPDPEP